METASNANAASAAASTGWLSRERKALELLFGPPRTRDFGVEFWDGSRDEPPGPNPPRFTLVLPSRGALKAMLLPPSELRLAQSYVNGVVDVRGDIEAAVDIGQVVRARVASPGRLAAAVWASLALPGDAKPRAADGLTLGRARHAPKHSVERDAAAVRAHYDMGNEFYSLWLDRNMVYSCAYFESENDSLEIAQHAKLELICRKLRLCAGERLLDIGCGWGGLLRHATVSRGVTGLGLTLSSAQAEYADGRIFDMGLAGRCAVAVQDYRQLDDRERFDKIVSVGMSEHVGPRNLPSYFEKAYRMLAPGGLFLNHSIVTRERPTRGFLAAAGGRIWRKGEFIERFIFPDGELVPLGMLISCAEDAGFEVRDVESLREHYVLTLRHWLSRLDAAAEDAIRLVGASTFRAWRLYLAGSASAFAAGTIGVDQVLLAKPDDRGAVRVPLTRHDLELSRDRSRRFRKPSIVRESVVREGPDGS